MRDKPELRNSVNPPLTRAAKAKFDQLRPRDDPGARCMESGVGRMMLTASPLQIVAFDNHRPNIRMAETSCTENNIYAPTNPANDKNFTSTDKPEPHPDAPSMPYPKRPASDKARRPLSMSRVSQFVTNM